jgi:hypothetical protein
LKTHLLGFRPIKRLCKSVEIWFRLLNRSFAMSDGFFWLSDEQFSKLQPLLPTGTRGKARVDDRRVSARRSGF